MGDLRAWINEGAKRWVVIAACVLLVAAAVAVAVWIVPWNATGPKARQTRNGSINTAPRGNPSKMGECRYSTVGGTGPPGCRKPVPSTASPHCADAIGATGLLLTRSLGPYNDWKTRRNGLAGQDEFRSSHR